MKHSMTGWLRIIRAHKHISLFCLLLLVLVNLPIWDDKARGRSQWSRTTPEINLSHLFNGEINARGKPVGFHSRPGGKDPQGARVSKQLAGPNRYGVYTARVAIQDSNNRQWKEKFSTFFPDSMDRQQVIDTVLHAWRHRTPGKHQPWQGPSGQGFAIQGYLNQRGNINTAFPLFRE